MTELSQQEQTIKSLLQSNMELSLALMNMRDKNSGHIAHLFGLPLNEIYDLILQKEANT